MRSPVVAALFVFAAFAADSGKELLNAARNGETAVVRSLLASGASIDSRDKNGKTPLMLAAENGRRDTVELLTKSGADPNVRDKNGFTAYGLALFSLSGSERTAILAMLPRPPRLKIYATATLFGDNLIGSCFQSREELGRLIAAIHPDTLALGAFAEYARTSGLELVEILTTESSGADAAVALDVRPGVACNRQSDDLSLAIDVRVTRPDSKTPVFEKTYGGGLTGMRVQPVTNPAQYQPFFDEWAKSRADSIYWGVVKALMRL